MGGGEALHGAGHPVLPLAVGVLVDADPVIAPHEERDRLVVVGGGVGAEATLVASGGGPRPAPVAVDHPALERAVRPCPAVDGDAIRVLGVGRQAVDDGVVDVLARRRGDHLPRPVAHLDGGPTIGGGRGTDAAALVAARAVEVVVVDHLPATVDELLEEPSPADQRSVRGHVDEVDEGLEAPVVVAHPRTVRPRRASDLDRAYRACRSRGLCRTSAAQQWSLAARPDQPTNRRPRRRRDATPRSLESLASSPAAAPTAPTTRCSATRADTVQLAPLCFEVGRVLRRPRNPRHPDRQIGVTSSISFQARRNHSPCRRECCPARSLALPPR